MDSCNSGSLQSSSGADEEYDSRAATDSISAFMNQLQSHPPPPHPPPPLTTPMTTITNNNNINPPVFDPLSYYLRLQNQSFPLNANMVWPKNTPPPGSDPNSGDIISNFIFTAVDNNPTTTSVAPPQPQPQPPPSAVSTGNQNQFPSQSQNHPPAARNPKKRSRASRRAPTTVLTTDTTNFRAMVQEFTGIPAPPFSSSPFPRSRVDLFGTPSSMRSNPLDSTVQPPFLLRPFAQKLHLPTPFLSSASSSSSSSLFSSSTPSINYHLSTESSNLSNIFQLNNNSSVKPRVSSDDRHVKIGGLNEFSLGQLGHQTHLSGLPNLISSDQMGSLRDDNNGDLPQIGYSASASSNFHSEKASTAAAENVAARSEGMVESWICSSD